MTRADFILNGHFSMGMVLGRMSISTPEQQAELVRILTPEEAEQARNHVRTLLQVKMAKK